MPNVLNADGLLVKLGASEGVSGTAGEWKTPTSQKVIDLELVLKNLTTTSTIIDDNLVIDKGYLIESIVLIGTEAAAGGTSFNVGVVYAGDRTSNAVATGIVNAQLTAAIVLGPLTLSNSAGAAVKTVTTQNLALTAQVSGTFTAGKVRVQITVSKP